MWAWGAAALLWALVWLHGTQTHGFTAVNETRLWLGFTWFDSGKFLCLPFAAVGLGIYLLGRDARLSRAIRVLWVLLSVVVAVQTVAVSAMFWPFPWGSYQLTFEELDASDGYPAVVQYAGIAQAIGSVIAAVLVVPVGVALTRLGRVRWWAVPAAAIGLLFTFFTTPASWIPAVGWLAVAWAAAAAPAHRSETGERRGTPQQA